jgi:hypothetical protein
MARTKFLIPLLAVTACAPSPFYVPPRHVGTVGEIPRDGRGEPIWSAITPVPAEEPYRPMPTYQPAPIPAPPPPASGQ